MTTLTPTQLVTAKEIVGYLSVGIPVNTAIAFCGNIAQESSFDPTIKGDGGVSYGLCQWQGNRLSNLEAWCTANGFDHASVEAQCKFILHELPTSDGVSDRVYGWLTDTSLNGQPIRPLKTLTADICDFYERPNQKYANLNARIDYANQVAAVVTSTPVPPAPPVPPPTPVPPIPKAEIFQVIQWLLQVLEGEA